MSTKHALITGASSGIGLAIARSLANQGYELDGVARDFSRTNFEQMHRHSIDLSDLDALPVALKQIGAIPDVLVLNAGYGQFGGLEQFSHQQVRKLVDTNLVSNLFLVKHFLPLMKQRGSGDIVLIGSESGLQGAKAGSVYCATKFAIRGLAQSLRADCSNNDIRVMLINPGPVDSEFFDTLNFEPQEGEEFVIPASAVADAVSAALLQPRSVVVDEVNLQPIKRSFRKK